MELSAMKKVIFILILSIGLSNFCRSETYITGDILTQTWTISGSPYIIKDAPSNPNSRHTIPSGNILTIEAGVVIRMVGVSGLIVEGEIRARGTSVNRIEFQGVPVNDVLGGWIEFLKSDPIEPNVMEYCDIDHLNGAPIINPWIQTKGSIGIISSSVLFNECRFSYNGYQFDNISITGGAIGVINGDSDVTITNCTFSENNAVEHGGAISINHQKDNLDNKITILNSTFLHNQANYSRAAGSIVNVKSVKSTGERDVGNEGGAIYCFNGELNITECVFTSNSGNNGGAIFYDASTNNDPLVKRELNIEQCTFSLNSALDDGGAICIGAAGGNQINISNSLIHHNNTFDVDGALCGGGIRFITSRHVSMIYNTIVDNNNLVKGLNPGERYRGDGIAFQYADELFISFKNNIVYNNGNNQDNIFSENSNKIIGNYNDVGPCGSGEYTYGTEDINAPPVFSIQEPYHLSYESPCIDAADPNDGGIDLGGKVRPIGAAPDMGAYEFEAETLIIIPDHDKICTDNSIEFTVAGIPESAIESYIWNMGDGITIAQDPPINHTYFNSGVSILPYVVHLTVMLKIGHKVEADKIIKVYPTPKLQVDPLCITQGETVHISCETSILVYRHSLRYEANDGGNSIAEGWGSLVDVDYVFPEEVVGEVVVYLMYEYNIGYELECYAEATIRVKSASCISPFAPLPNKEYVLSAWVSEDMFDPPQTTFTTPAIQVSFLLSDGTTNEIPSFTATGPIIDGWQKIEQPFTVPNNAVDITVSLINANWEIDSYFDDIRIFPIGGNMKSYVYDPVNLRFVAELDENNYATFFEYDQEGKLTRLKKETEQGIVTLKESRSHMSRLSF